MESADTKKKCPGSEPGDSGLSSQFPVGGAKARMANPVGDQAGPIKNIGNKVKIKEQIDKSKLILTLLLIMLCNLTKSSPSIGKMWITLNTTDIDLSKFPYNNDNDINIFTKVIPYGDQ